MNYKEWKRAELGYEDLNGSAKQQIAGLRYGKNLGVQFLIVELRSDCDEQRSKEKK